MTLFRIEAPHFTAGIIFQDNNTIRTAPIIRYMIGWSYSKVEAYCRKKSWKVLKVE